MAADGEKQPLNSAPSRSNGCGAPPSPGNNRRDSETPATPPSTTTDAQTTSEPDAQQTPSEPSTYAGYGSTQDDNLESYPSLLRQSGEGDIVADRISGHSDGSGRKSQDSEIHFDEQGVKDRTCSFSSPLLYFSTEEVAIFNPNDHPHAVSPRPPAGDQQADARSFISPVRSKPHMWTFRGRSPRFIRFGMLVLITMVPFGAHFTKNCFSSLDVYFLQDPKLHFNETKYGALMSAISLPNVIMPFFGGLFLDAKGHKQGILLFLTITLTGHLIFTLAMGLGNFWLAIVGEALHGLGSGTVLVAMRAIVSKFFLEKELTFALGVTVGGACISKTLAKASVAPIAEARWGYMGALWYVAIWQVLSLIAGLSYVRMARSAHDYLGMQKDEVGHADFRPRSLLLALRSSTLAFWVVAVLHTLFMTAYHLFANFSGHFLVENYGVSPVLAGYMSSLQPLVVVFCAPLAGLVLDYWGGQIFVLLLANLVTIVAYLLLWQEQAGAAVCLVMLALCESFVPTILLSALPLTVDQSVYGAAFGMAEVISAFATIVSNVYFGYSRDVTESYHRDLAFLLVICLVCFALTLFLLYWDTRCGRSKLNHPRKEFGLVTVAS